MTAQIQTTPKTVSVLGVSGLREHRGAVGLLYLFVVANNIKVIRKRNAINKGK